MGYLALKSDPRDLIVLLISRYSIINRLLDGRIRYLRFGARERVVDHYGALQLHLCFYKDTC